VIDLGERKQIEHVSLGCLQDNNSWIFFPQSVVFSFSDDGVKFRDAFVVPNDVPPQEMTVMIKEFHAPVQNIFARYVHVNVTNLGVCPHWHKGAGNKAWLFVDEIRINAK